MKKLNKDPKTLFGAALGGILILAAFIIGNHFLYLFFTDQQEVFRSFHIIRAVLYVGSAGIVAVFYCFFAMFLIAVLSSYISQCFKNLYNEVEEPEKPEANYQEDYDPLNEKVKELEKEIKQEALCDKLGFNGLEDKVSLPVEMRLEMLRRELKENV